MQDATRATRYLAIMVRMTSHGLLIEVCTILLKIGRLTRRFRCGEISPATMVQFEMELDGLLRELGRRIVQWTVNGLEPEERSEMPGQFLWNGDYYRRRDTSPLRNLNCLFGPIKLVRYCYQPLETCGKCLFPLQIQLGIVAGVATPALADWVARRAADHTQRQLLDQLRSRGITWGVGTLRTVTHAMAETVFFRDSSTSLIAATIRRSTLNRFSARCQTRVGPRSSWSGSGLSTTTTPANISRRWPKAFSAQAGRRLPGPPSSAQF